MCIGIPMRILKAGPGWALGTRGGDESEDERIDMRLIGDQPVGTWVLVFLGSAREVLGEQQARQIQEALQALALVREGDDIDHLFADLVNRDPELPDHLKAVDGKG